MDSGRVLGGFSGHAVISSCQDCEFRDYLCKTQSRLFFAAGVATIFDLFGFRDRPPVWPFVGLYCVR